MRSARPLVCLAIFVAGCANDPTIPITSMTPPLPVPPSLMIRLDQPPSRVEGLVRIEVATDTPESFFGLELRLGDTVVKNFKQPPFVTTLKSETFSDGHVVLRATGILIDSAKPIEASLDVELANFPPIIELNSPINGDIVTGSPSKGFSVAPILKAADGNGIVALWGDAGQGIVDLGPGDGSVLLPLQTGTEFPHDPVTITLFAQDGSGDVSQIEAMLTPTNTVMRLDAPVPGGQINRAEAWANGAVAIDLGSNMGYPGGVYTMTKPAVPAMTTLSLSGSHIYARNGEQLILETGSSNGIHLQRADIATGNVADLLSLQYDFNAKQAMGFKPIFHSSGRIYSSWIKFDTFDTHLLAFEADGSKRFDMVFPGITISGTPTEQSDGQLWAVLGPSQSPPSSHWFQRIDATTGALLLPAWAAPAGSILHQDAIGVVTAGSTNGPPWAVTVTRRMWPNGTVVWSHEVGNGSLMYSQWVPPDSIHVLIIDTSSGGSGSKWVRAGANGTQVLWNAPPNTMVSPTIHKADASSIYVNLYNTSTTASSFGRLLQDGTLTWTRKGHTLSVLSNGDVISLDGTDLQCVSIEGTIRWTKPLTSGANVRTVVPYDNLILLGYDTGEGMPFYYEALDGQTGERRWRYGEGPASASYARGTVIPVTPWGAVLTTIVPQDPTSISVLGLIP